MRRLDAEEIPLGFEPVALSDRLEAMRESSGAEALLVLDGSGSVVASSGEKLDLDPVAFGSLACMHVAASIGLASLVGGVEFRALFQQGNGATILLSKVANDWIAAFVRTGQPPVEMTEHTEMSVAQLEQIIEVGGYQTPSGGPVDPGWGPAAESEIDRVFGEGA